MYSLNRATVLGNITRDPEIRNTAGGQQVCSFSVATNRSWTDKSGAKQDQAEYHNVVAWGKLAEIVGSYVKKGSKIYVEGRLQTRDWQGQDGLKRNRTEIVADNVIILDRASGAPGAPRMAASAFGVPPATPADDPAAVPPEEEIKVEDIPF